jgi:hypothetical protein
MALARRRKDFNSLAVDQGLVEVEAVQVELHGRDTHGCQPGAEDRPQGKEEVQGALVFERSVSEDEAANVSVSGDDVVRFFFLSKLEASVDQLVFGSFANERRGDQ